MNFLNKLFSTIRKRNEIEKKNEDINEKKKLFSANKETDEADNKNEDINFKEIWATENFDDFYFDKLPKFVKILKDDLTKQIDKKNDIVIADYIKIFFEFYQLNSVYDYFKVFKPENDKMYLGIYLGGYENSIYIERGFWLESESTDEYQIQFELILDIPSPEKRIGETFEIEREINGDFSNYSNYEETYICFEDFQEKVLTSSLLSDFLNLQPKNIQIRLHTDA